MIRRTQLPTTWYVYPIVTAIMLFACVLQTSTAATNEQPSASGRFQISLTDGPSRTIDFSARIENDGTTTGQMTFQDSETSPEPKATAESEFVEPKASLSFKVNFDCLVIEGNKAVMSGTVIEANLERYLGKRFLLVVQDNGHGLIPGKGDKLTFGIYRPAPEFRWTTDAERPDDPGGATWIATDAERSDDAGVLSRTNEEIGCRSFPLSAFSFISAAQGHGKISVRNSAPASGSSK